MSEPISRARRRPRRRTLADRAVPAVERLAALDGLVALGVDPRRWWFQREWTDTGRPLHEHLRASYSKLDVLDNCELQFVLGSELGLGRPVGYHAWVGSLVHRIIEDCEKGEVERTPRGAAEVDARWRAGVPCDRGVRGVAHTGQGADAAQLVRAVRRPSGIRHRAPGSSSTTTTPRSSATSTGSGRPRRVPRREDHRLQDGQRDRAPKANESLQLGIYYLAVLESEELKEFQPVSGVEFSYLKGDWRDGALVTREWTVGTRIARRPTRT